MLDHLLHKIRQLRPPPAPVVRHVEAPEIDPAVDALFVKDLCNAAIGGEHLVLPSALPDANGDLALIMPGDVRMVRRHTREIIHWGIEVDQVVEEIAKAVVRVVEAGERDHGIEHVGPAKEEVCGMKTAHRTAGGQDAARLCAAVCLPVEIEDAGGQLVYDIGKPALVLLDARASITARGRPGFAVDRVAAEDLNAPFLDETADAVDHAVVLKVKKAPILGWKGQYRLARVAEHLEFHVSPEGVRVFAKILCLHNFPPLHHRCID